MSAALTSTLFRLNSVVVFCTVVWQDWRLFVTLCPTSCVLVCFWAGVSESDTLLTSRLLSLPSSPVRVCTCLRACACTVGPSVSGYDDTPGDNPPADAADPPAAGPEPPAAPGAPAAATGPHVTAGTTHTTHRPHYQPSSTNSNAHGRFHIYSTIKLTSVEPPLRHCTPECVCTAGACPTSQDQV